MTDIHKEDLFDGGDFVIMEKIKEDGTKEICGGGYKINSLFLQKGIAPMTTYNTEEQTGGRVSSSFENLAVPAGLFYVNVRQPKTHTSSKHYDTHNALPEDIMDKLINLVNADTKIKKHTKKRLSLGTKLKTRRHK